LKIRDLALAGATLTAFAPHAAGQQRAPRVRWAHITYLTTATAYIDAGRADGLRDTSRVSVVRGDSTVAILPITFLATHRAACDLAGVTGALSVGDSVRFAAAADAVDSATAVAAVVAAPRAAPPPAGWRPNGGLRGRVGLYYLLIRPRDGSGAQFAQPSGDVRLSGNDLGGSGLGISVDMRSRRTLQTRADGLGSDARQQTRVYQGALSWQAAGSPLRLTAGRQWAPGMPSVGLVDGVSAQLDAAGWSGGAFAGSEPEPVNLDLSRTITQVGGYVQRHSRVGSPGRWSLSAGLSGSYLRSGTNREFLYLQGEYGTRRLSLFASQEVDYYRPWRRVGGERAISPTSTFASLQFRLSDAISVTTGVDNRRNARLYRDVVNPEITFDDAFRRGAWVGVSAHTGRFLGSVDARTSAGGSAGATGSYTLSLGANRLTRYGLSVRSRNTRYTSVGRSGWLQALTVGVEPGGLGSVQLTGGQRIERDGVSGASTVRWLSTDLDLSLGRRWMAVVSAYREQGGSTATDLLYAGLSFRF
jgi:hypothetical protein